MINYQEGHFGREHPLYQEVNERYLAQKPFTSSDFEKMTDTEHAAVLHHSAELQRGAPEEAMLHIQRKLQGGSFPFDAEHLGDLYWRANHMHGATRSGNFNDVDNKVAKTLRGLTHPYGYERTIKEDLAGSGNTMDEVRVLGQAYAKEHAKLPVYTYPSHLMSQITQHFGNLRFGATVGGLETLKPMVLHPNHDKFSWSEPSKEEMEENQRHADAMAQKWNAAHSRGATIDFLKSVGR